MKNCFVKYQPTFNYEIEYEGELLCECHSLSTREFNEILRKCTIDNKLVNGKLIREYDNYKDSTMTAMYAIDKWTLEDDEGNIVEVNEENWGNLDVRISSYILSEIRKHESDKMLEDISKN